MNPNGTICGTAPAIPQAFLKRDTVVGAGAPPVAKQEVPRELDQLHSALSVLEQALQILRQRLESVSRGADTASAGAAACTPGCSSSVGQQVNSAFYRVLGLTASVTEALDTLAI